MPVTDTCEMAGAIIYHGTPLTPRRALNDSPPPSKKGSAMVRDEDREAAADQWARLFVGLDADPLTERAIRAGEYDSSPEVQAFARHRAATEAGIVAWLIRQAESIDRLSGEAITEQSKRDLIVMSGARRECAKAIESGAHRKEA